MIGYCSGGRQAFLAACRLPLDAAVDCYGAFVMDAPPEGLPLKVVPVVGLAGNLSCPLLGLFGAEDDPPVPDRDGPSSSRSWPATARPSSSTPTRAPATASSPSTGPATGPRRPPTAGGGSGSCSAATWPPRRGSPMCTYHTERVEVAGSGKGPDGWFPSPTGHRLLRPSPARPGRAHPEHRLPQPRPGPVGPGRRRAQRGVRAGPGRRDPCRPRRRHCHLAGARYPA